MNVRLQGIILAGVCLHVTFNIFVTHSIKLIESSLDTREICNNHTNKLIQ